MVCKWVHMGMIGKVLQLKQNEFSQQVLSSKHYQVIVASYCTVVCFLAKVLVSGGCSQPEWLAAEDSVPPDCWTTIVSESC